MSECREGGRVRVRVRVRACMTVCTVLQIDFSASFVRIYRLF
jgi:hypothetical protein